MEANLRVSVPPELSKFPCLNSFRCVKQLMARNALQMHSSHFFPTKQISICQSPYIHTLPVVRSEIKLASTVLYRDLGGASNVIWVIVCMSRVNCVRYLVPRYPLPKHQQMLRIHWYTPQCKVLSKIPLDPNSIMLNMSEMIATQLLEGLSSVAMVNGVVHQT